MSKPIEEIYWLRFYGALAVFTFHLIDRIERYYLETTALRPAADPDVTRDANLYLYLDLSIFVALRRKNSA